MFGPTHVVVRAVAPMALGRSGCCSGASAHSAHRCREGKPPLANCNSQPLCEGRLHTRVVPLLGGHRPLRSGARRALLGSLLLWWQSCSPPLVQQTSFYIGPVGRYVRGAPRASLLARGRRLSDANVQLSTQVSAPRLPVPVHQTCLHHHVLGICSRHLSLAQLCAQRCAPVTHKNVLNGMCSCTAYFDRGLRRIAPLSVSAYSWTHPRVMRYALADLSNAARRGDIIGERGMPSVT